MLKLLVDVRDAEEKLQDLLAVKDMHHTIGYIAWADKVASEDAVIIDALRCAGAVIYVKTTAAQSAMVYLFLTPRLVPKRTY
jgi:Asp-tRNA(Asn)/Glu-tRNA(Gln) amidotransferase A subunit family amidase